MIKRWHFYVLAALVAAALWWRWRSKTVNVKATVTIPQDEIRVRTSGRSLFSVTTGKADANTFGPPPPIGSILTDGVTTVPDELRAQLQDDSV